MMFFIMTIFIKIILISSENVLFSQLFYILKRTSHLSFTYIIFSLQHRTFLRSNSKVNKSKNENLEKLSNYNEVQEYSINTISEIDTTLSIKVYYQKSKKRINF